MTQPLTTFPVVHVAGVPFHATSLEDAAESILKMASERSAYPNVRLANAYNVALAKEDPSYGALLTQEGVNLPDGTPVVWFMNLRNRGARAGRVRGPSLFPLVLRKSVGRGTRHFLLGSTPETLKRLEATIRSTHPDIAIAGSYSPPFVPIDAAYVADCAKRVRASDADIVWLGLGTPKQDQLGTALSREIDIPTLNVGAAFDYLAGTVREAPVWIQRSGFEWLYRLLAEPKRLWRRYLIGNVRFLVAATHHLIRDALRRRTDA